MIFSLPDEALLAPGSFSLKFLPGLPYDTFHQWWMTMPSFELF
jgi:hypothetical protein